MSIYSILVVFLRTCEHDLDKLQLLLLLPLSICIILSKLHLFLIYSNHKMLFFCTLVQILCDIYSSSVQDYLFPLSFVFQTWIFLLCYFSCGRQTCFDCSTGGLSFPSHRLSLFYSTGIARGCLFSTKQKPPPFGGGFLCAALLIYNASGYIKRS